MAFLTKPAVQAYIDPVLGSVGWSAAAVPGSANIVGITSGNHIAHQFNASNGTFLNSFDVSTIGLFLEFSSVLIWGDDGKLWGYNDSPGGGVDTFCHVDPSNTPYVLDDTWGTNAVPGGAPNPGSLAWLKTGNARWLVWGGFAQANPSYQIIVLGANPPAYPTGRFGFWGHAYSDSSALAGSTDVCTGPETATSSTAYWTNKPYSIYGAAFCLGSTVILPAAPLYNPASWPTANPYITSTVIKTYAPTDFDAAWTAITYLSGPAYDSTDGNVLVQVEGTGGGNPSYIAKLNTGTGAVMWKLSVNGSGFDLEAPTSSRIANGIYLYYVQGSGFTGTVYVINTATGVATTEAVTGISGFTQQVSDDVAGSIIGNVGWNVADGNILLLNSTPASGATLGQVYFIQSETPPLVPLSAISYTRIWGSWNV